MKPERDEMQALKKELKERELVGSRLGIDEKGLSPAQFEVIKSSFSEAKVIPANHIFRKIRMVKTKEEIERIRQATEINEQGLQTLLDTIQEGKTEKEVTKAHDDTLVELGCSPHHTCVQGGTRGALINGEPTEYRFKMGDGIGLDFDCINSGYFSDIARTAVVGPRSQKLKTYQKAVMEGVLAAEEIVETSVLMKNLSSRFAFTSIKRYLDFKLPI